MPFDRLVPFEGPPAIVLDLDGVLWLGDEPLPGAADAVARFRAAGLAVGFMTNNSSLPVAGYVEKLGRFGVPADPSEVLTSALAAADLLAADLGPGSKILACSGPGVVEALEAKGFEVVDAGPAEAVVVGWHRTFDFDRLERASAAIRAGARFVATNLDATYPAADGLLPGNGSLVAAVATAAGCRAGGGRKAGAADGGPRPGEVRRPGGHGRRPPVHRRGPGPGAGLAVRPGGLVGHPVGRRTGRLPRRLRGPEPGRPGRGDHRAPSGRGR